MKRRWLKRSLIALAALLVLLVLVVAWIGGTSSGLRFVLGRAVIALEDKFSYASAEGSLFGGLTLHDVRYQDPAIGDYRVALIEVAPRSRRLFTGELHLTGLLLREVRVVLPPPNDEPSPDEEPFVLPVVIAPVSMRIDDLKIENVDVRAHDDTPVIALDRIAGAAAWRGAAFDIERLDVDAPEGEIRARAAIDTAADWAGDAAADFRWQLQDQPNPFAGTVALRGPQQQPSLRLDLSEPSVATVDLSWLPGMGEREWRLDARSEAFNLSTLIVDPPVQMLRFDIDGQGTAGTANITGRIELDGYAVLLEELAGSYRNQQIVIDALSLAEANGPGRLDGSARVDLSADVPTGSIDMRWQSVTPMLDAPFDQLAANGRIVANGSLERLVADIEADATVDRKPLRLELHAEGDPRNELRFAPLLVTTGNGRLSADGTLQMAPELAWQAQLQARDFDPGLLLPDWPGRVNLEAKTQGSLIDDIVNARMDIERLGGTLRQRPLAGSGHVELAGTDRIDADLDVRLGDNAIRFDGRAGSEYDARARFAIRDFALFLDDAAGHADGDVTLRGRWPALSVAGRIEGGDLSLSGTQIGTLAADVDLRTDFGDEGTLDIDAQNLVLAGETIQQLRLEGRGDAENNSLQLTLEAERGNATLEMAGRYDADSSTWAGRLQTLALTMPELPAPLSLREPAALRLSSEQIALEQACLTSESSALCLDGDWRSGEGGQVGFDMTRLPLAWLVALGGDETLIASGELGGHGRLRIAADAAVTGEAQIEGTPGSIRLLEPGNDSDGQRDLVAWSRLATTVQLDGGRRGIEAIAELSPAGQLRARIDTAPQEGGDSTLAGSIDVDLPDLSFIELLTPDVVRPVGRLQGRLTLGGTTDAPRTQGDIDLRGFRAELPALGLKLRDSSIALRGGNGNRIEVDGRIATADDSTLLLGGWFGLPADGRVPMDLRITGERVLVADIPAARVFVTPDLTVTATADRLNVRGTVDIPQARIMPEEIEGGVAATSPDVHIVDADVQAAEAAVEQNALPLFARVDVRLGDRVNIEGYGLKGRLSGQLQVRERPGRVTSGRGEIVVTGVYQAYGQDLDIKRGRLLFSNSPLDNPMLDIRATRKIEAVTAGLTVTGNAQRPVLEVYSVPPMDQAEALSYLVLGRPLRQATSASDQDALGTAATAVTTAGGDLLAKSLGARLGLDEVGVGTSRDLGAGALTVGKYLSPRLYLGYGRSLFDGSQLVSLRYRLTERFELEAQSGTRENKAGINYRYEK